MPRRRYRSSLAKIGLFAVSFGERTSSKAPIWSRHERLIYMQLPTAIGFCAARTAFASAHAVSIARSAPQLDFFHEERFE